MLIQFVYAIKWHILSRLHCVKTYSNLTKILINILSAPMQLVDEKRYGKLKTAVSGHFNATNL